MTGDDEERTPDDGEADEAAEASPPDHGAAASPGILEPFARTLWSCLRHPTSFFSQVATSEDRWEAMGFAMVMHLLGFGAAALWELVFAPEEFKLALIRVAIAPIWVLASIWIGSEMMHGWLGILRGTRASRSVTHRVVAYCYATAALGAVPFVPFRVPGTSIEQLSGLQLGLLAAIVYQAIALRQAHRAPAWKAAAAVALTWLVLAGGVVLLILGSGATEAVPPE
jgi:hypothetical protein